MTSANKGFRDPVVPPKVALIGIACMFGVWIIAIAGSRGCGSGSADQDTPARGATPGTPRRSVEQRTAPPHRNEPRGTTPAVPPVLTVPSDAHGFVTVPIGTREVRLTLKKEVMSPWLVLPLNHGYDMKHDLFPIKIQRWGEKPITVASSEEVFHLSDGKLRILAPEREGELIIYLSPQ